MSKRFIAALHIQSFPKLPSTYISSIIIIGNINDDAQYTRTLAIRSCLFADECPLSNSLMNLWKHKSDRRIYRLPNPSSFFQVIRIIYDSIIIAKTDANLFQDGQTNGQKLGNKYAILCMRKWTEKYSSLIYISMHNIAIWCKFVDWNHNNRKVTITVCWTGVYCQNNVVPSCDPK
jgi:hypothetical protein